MGWGAGCASLLSTSGLRTDLKAMLLTCKRTPVGRGKKEDEFMRELQPICAWFSSLTSCGIVLKYTFSSGFPITFPNTSSSRRDAFLGSLKEFKRSTPLSFPGFCFPSCHPTSSVGEAASPAISLSGSQALLCQAPSRMSVDVTGDVDKSYLNCWLRLDTVMALQ